ncbi:unnamed protein product [Phytomonas sp. EM1]|nr:unnamed protein product [Phytomonas sp. EM1]|eukprot:CCW64656.1 unnamed protein product [Phytomonas sp. isolate EM1]
MELAVRKKQEQLTYMEALRMLSRRVVLAAHRLRHQQIHFSHKLLPLIHMANKSWAKSMLRIVMQAWHAAVQELQRLQRQHRSRWAKRLSGEQLRFCIRNWRTCAVYMLRRSETENVTMAIIVEKREAIQRMQAEAESLREVSRNLSDSMTKIEKNRQVMEAALLELENQYKERIEQVNDLDQIGTMLIEGNLCSASIPMEARCPDAGATPLQVMIHLVQWANTMVTMANGGETSVDEKPIPLDLNEDRKDKEEEDEGAMALNETSTLASGDDLQDGFWSGYHKTAPGVFDDLLHCHPLLEEYIARSRKDPLGSSTVEGDPATTASAIPPVSLITYNHFMRLMRICFAPQQLKETSSLAGPERRPMAGTESDSMSTVVAPAIPTEIPPLEAGGDDSAPPPATSPDTSEERKLEAQVRAADAAVVAALRAKLGPAHGSGSDGEKDVEFASDAGVESPPNTSWNSYETEGTLLALLTPELCTQAKTACTIVLNTYERLTNTTCVVTLDQLLQRDRRALLVLLAGLLRYYTNWWAPRTQNNVSASSSNSVFYRASFDAGELMSSSRLMHQGRHHWRYQEWKHPLSTHLTWFGRVLQQQRWVAFSFSALHVAVDLAMSRNLSTTELDNPNQRNLMEGQTLVSLRSAAKCYSRRTTAEIEAVPLEYQERAAKLMQALSFAKLSYIFHPPAAPVLHDSRNVALSMARASSARNKSSSEQTLQRYIHFLGIIKGFFIHLWHLFKLYSCATRDLEGDLAIYDGLTPHGLAEEASGGGKAREAPKVEDRYLTLNGFWHLLCDGGLAGGSMRAREGSKKRLNAPDSGDLFAPSLDRLSVTSIVERVVLQNCVDTSPSRLSGVSESLEDFTQSPTSVLSKGTPGSDEALLAPPRGVLVCLSAAESKDAPANRGFQTKTTMLANYANAIQSGQHHVDLRQTNRGTLCMNFEQFCEALVRCTHALQSIRDSHTRFCPLEDTVRGSEAAGGEGEGSADLTRANPDGVFHVDHASKSTGQDSNPLSLKPGSYGGGSNAGRPFLRQGSTSSRCISHRSEDSVERMMEGEGGSIRLSRTGNATRVRYGGRSPHGNDDELSPLSLEGLEGIWGEELIPLVQLRPLSEGPYARFRRGIRRPAVQLCLARQQEGLFRVFVRHAKPREADGVASALLPNAFAVFCWEGERGGWARAAPEEHVPPSSTSSSFSSSQRRTLGTCDIGIILVLQLADVKNMARELRWERCLRLNRSADPAYNIDKVLEECFHWVLADPGREGEVLFFSEFLDLLCALAEYSILFPSPLTPLETKLEDLITQCLVA